MNLKTAHQLSQFCLTAKPSAQHRNMPDINGHLLPGWINTDPTGYPSDFGPGMVAEPTFDVDETRDHAGRDAYCASESDK